MKIDRQLLNRQIAILSIVLDEEPTQYRKDVIEGVLNLLEEISDAEQSPVAIELI